MMERFTFGGILAKGMGWPVPGRLAILKREEDYD